MNDTLVLQEPYGGLSRARDEVLKVGLFLVIVRLLINIPALVGANGFVLDPHLIRGGWGLSQTAIPGAWVRWDAVHYLNIAILGYPLHTADLAFFPAYPFLIRAAWAVLSIDMVWAGFLIANLAFVLACLLLWQLVREEFNTSIAWATIISLNLFPTSFYFSAIYTESLFLLFAVLVYWFSVRGDYPLAALFVVAASLTRVNGLLLALIPILEILRARPPHYRMQIAATGLVSISGFGLYTVYLWLTQGSPLAFALAQANWDRKMTAPWQSIADSLGVWVFGLGRTAGNPLMRANSLQDVLITLLFIVLIIYGFFLVRKSLFAFSAATMLLYLVSHGPYPLGLWSLSRFVLVLFPAFMVMGILLDRKPEVKWGIWAFSAVFLFFLTAFFTNGQWVA